MINGIIIVYFWYDWFIYKQSNKLLAPKNDANIFYKKKFQHNVLIRFLFKEEKKQRFTMQFHFVWWWAQ